MVSTAVVSMAMALGGVSWATPDSSAFPLGRCGTASHRPVELPGWQLEGEPADCSATFTNPDQRYAEGGRLDLKLVFHVFTTADGTRGQIPMSRIEEQVRVLNEDFRALASTPGAAGLDTRLAFSLARFDPRGDPAPGVYYYSDNAAFEDRGEYWEGREWEPRRYVNVYTNNASGLLGYTFLPADATSEPGRSSDRIVIHWTRLGVEESTDPDASRGRTLTHEMGHYLGLDHTFAPNPTVPETFLCPAADAPGCYEEGDLLCDTPSEDAPSESCAPKQSCGSDDAVANYMNYTPDACVSEFTYEQQLRMRCTLESFRPDVSWPAARLVLLDAQRESDRVVYRTRLINDAPVGERFDLTLTPGSFPAAFSADTNTQESNWLEPGESQEFDVTITIPANTPDDGESLSWLTATTPENQAPETLSILTRATPTTDFLLSRSSAAVRGTALEPTSTTFTLTNRAEVEDEFQLSIASEWAASFSHNESTADVVTLGPGQSQPLSLSVRIPSEAPPDASNLLTVHGRSSRTPGLEQSVSIQVVANAYAVPQLALASPIPASPPDAHVASQLVVSNHGNSTAHFRLHAEVTGPGTVTAAPTRIGPVPSELFGSSPLEVPFTLHVDPSARAGEVIAAEFIATAESLPSSIATTRFETEVAPVGRLRLEPAQQIRAAIPGDLVRLELRLTQAANFDDRYDLELDTESTVQKAPGSPLTLLAGETSTLAFLLVRGATVDPEHTTVRVRSRSDASRVAHSELVLTLARDPEDAGAPLLPRDAGDLDSPERRDALPPSKLGCRSDAGSCDSGLKERLDEQRPSGCQCWLSTIATAKTSEPFPSHWSWTMLALGPWIRRKTRALKSESVP